MDLQSLLNLYAFAVEQAERLPNNTSAVQKSGGYSRFFGHKSVGRFCLVTRIQIGPRGGISMFACLVDRELKPLVDAIRFIEEPSIFLPIAFRQQVTNHDFLEVINNHLKTLPTEESFYSAHFDRLASSQTGLSIKGLQGGSPGLRK